MSILWLFHFWLIIKSLFFTDFAFKVVSLMLLTISKPCDSMILICFKLL